MEITKNANLVLTFWFGDTPFSTTHSSNPTVQSSISKHYTNLWFPSADAQIKADQSIQSKFTKLLQDAENNLLNDWIQQPFSLCALIIILDQFSRHIYRHTTPHKNDKRALELAEIMLENQWHIYLPVPMEIFALMPLRHSPTVVRLERVLSEIERRTVGQQASTDLLEKFRKTTTNKLEMLKDAALKSSKNSSSSSTSSGNGIIEGDYDAILERCAFTANEMQLGTHKLVHTMKKFLQRHIYPQQQTTSNTNTNTIVVAVSLSGGVDSMVIARILVYLRDQFAAAKALNTGGVDLVPPSTPVLHVVALHLDYGNRSESSQENEYVQKWCETFNITYHSRTINEIQRSTTPRDEYEKRSRQIRYDFYRQILNQYVTATNTTSTATSTTTSSSTIIPGTLKI